MAEFPALPLFTDAYLGDTTHLTTFEHGAYMLLLIVSWRSPGCCLPDDDKLLARYTRMTVDKWRKTRPSLEPFFAIDDGCWHQARLQDELQHLRSQREARSKAGRAGNDAKALKRKERRSAKGNAVRTQKPRKPDAPLPLPTTLDKSKEIISSNEDKSVGTDPPVSKQEILEAWEQRMVPLGFPAIRKMTPHRERQLKARLKDSTIEEWQMAMDALERSPFLRGENPRGWKADFDFLLQPKSFTKLIEGSYDH